MNIIFEALQYVVNLGSTFMLPVIIFIIGLCLRLGIGKSLRAGLTVGIGFVGVNLVVSLMTGDLGSAAKAMAENFNLNLSIIDLGWPGTSPMAWASDVGIIAIPVAIGVNILMLCVRATRVVNVDIWNVWHMAFTGAIVEMATGNFAIALVCVAIHAAIAYKLGDMFVPVTDGYFELEGMAMPHGTSAYMGVFAAPVDDLLDRIPLINRINITPETVEEKLGVLGQPMIIGFFLGFLIGLLAGYDVGRAGTLAVEMAAVMKLMPLVVKFIMEGLMPISEAAREMLNKHFKGGDFRIGLDCALMLGDPAVVASSMLFVPLTLLIAVIMPGNRILPFGDLATIGFFVAIAVGVHKGNVFRTLFSGALIMSITLWIANQMAGLQQALGRSVGLVKAGEQISSLDQSGSPITFLLTRATTTDLGIGFIVIAALWIGAFAYTYICYKRGRLFKSRNAAERSAEHDASREAGKVEIA
ncbi:PTS system Galactitol-specific IIC component [Coriobacterium glomerans PW2]|uniref:PTS system Galactitol-specific IIC component n=1 Tax=Coriobacterium glomerans (strain ATCC 49209 / DSM 20642 / JCM 10262 / PW2) TaxID=700015 RepID=F2NAK7_CORGP|nr:PTS transporter subunit IIC [Coriobacterium glomerans]AEB06534.1 PTS system Galactitol-specific IIC component [Coriobacterium glomerans PW2]